MQGKHGHTYEPHSSCIFCLMCSWFPLCFCSNVSYQFLTLRNSHAVVCVPWAHLHLIFWKN